MDKKKIKKTASETIKEMKKGMVKVSFAEDIAGGGGLDSTPNVLFDPLSYMKVKTTEWKPEMVKQAKKKVPKKTKAPEINTNEFLAGFKISGANLAYTPPKKRRRVERKFKLSDFKFSPVKRVNTRLARETLQTDLGIDILEDIVNLDIGIKIT